MALALSHPAATRHTGFACLDREWASQCRLHRNNQTMLGRWAESEPALIGIDRLEDLVPPPGRDRYRRFGALARLTASGDSLAARVLLQLLVPGLARLSGDLESGRLDDDVAGDVIAAAWAYIERLRVGDLHWWAPTYVLRSVRRDLLAERARERRRMQEIGPSLVPVASDDQRSGAPSAESSVLGGSGARALLSEAVQGGTISSTAADVLWLSVVSDRPVPAVARAVGLPVSTAYRLRRQAVIALRTALAPTAVSQSAAHGTGLS